MSAHVFIFIVLLESNHNLCMAPKPIKNQRIIYKLTFSGPRKKYIWFVRSKSKPIMQLFTQGHCIKEAANTPYQFHLPNIGSPQTTHAIFEAGNFSDWAHNYSTSHQRCVMSKVLKASGSCWQCSTW